MTDRTMRPVPYLAALAVLVWSFAPAQRASAQLAINSNATIYIKPEGGSKEEKLDNGSNVYINSAQAHGTWRIELQGYFSPVNYLELWAANSTTTNCADPANRQSANLTASNCWPIATQTNVNGKVSFRDLDGCKLFDRTGNCPPVRGTKFKIQFVTLDAPTQGMTTSAPASNNNANQVSAVFTLYAQLPDAPTNIKAIEGDETIGISWGKINNDPLTQYRVYFDHDPNAVPMPSDGMDGGAGVDAGTVTCGTGKFNSTTTTLEDGGTTTTAHAGGDLTIDNMITFQSGKTKGKSATIDGLDRKGIALDTYTAVAVAAIDGAGNIGYLSTPICVKRTAAIGYLEACRDAGVECGELESCSLSPRNTGSAFWLSAGTLALSAWARRRRRSN